MAKNLSKYAKKRIITLYRLGLMYAEIVKVLSAEGISCSRFAVARTVRKFLLTNSITNKPKTGRPKKYNDIHEQFIDQCYEENDELPAHEIAAKIKDKFNIDISATLVRNIRSKLGWTLKKPRYCQVVREVNQEKRLVFAKACLESGEQFDDVIFTDESTIEMEWHARMSFNKKGKKPKLKPKPKHPYKVHVWAGISKRGATQVLIFTGIMRKEFYADRILGKVLLPFIEKKFPDGHRFQQDNDPKHTSKYTAEFMVKNGINWWRTPPESPDLNPIENVWHELKEHIRKKVKPKKKDELVNGILQFWAKFSKKRCNQYINHLHKVLPVVIEKEGQATGY